MKPKANILKYLEIVAPILPVPIYWEDVDSVILGANKLVLEGVGVNSPDEYLNKNLYEIYPKEMAEHIKLHNEQVMSEGKILSQEEPIEDKMGQIKYYNAIKAPLHDDHGNIIGVVGTSIEITAQKEAERLKLANDQLRFENQRLEFERHAQKISAELDAYKKFKQIADQMAHDLGSPLMALSVLENSCAELPEEKRNMLRESISRIRDIAGSLLSQYKPLEEDADKIVSEELLVYAALEQVLMDKQYEYHNLDIKFEGDSDKDSVFSFIEANPSSFKRMLSNLINNSVDAIEDRKGNITIKLISNKEEVKVSIIDTGKGMPETVVNKLINNISFTSGKENGRGIGYTQIHETLKQSNGKIELTSHPGIGTTITITFPRIKTPEWLAEQIIVNPTDIIIILDDDNSIHGAWDIRFSDIVRINPGIQIKHFKQANEVITFIDGLREEEKPHIFLLTDYELLKQSLNGLDVIERVKLKRSILVTSHYNNIKTQEGARRLNTRILPKILASNIDIRLLN